MTELMKRYDKDTGCSSTTIWRGEIIVSNKYVAWLEDQLTWRPVREKPDKNGDGVLPCPSCGEYPTLKEELDENDERIYAVEHECNIYMTTGWNHDRQTVIDAWNRRV